MDHYSKYDREVIPGIEESLSRIADQISTHSVVLDIGCSTGMMGRHLALQKGCVVDGVDIDEAALENCRPVYRKVAIRNLETDELTDVFRQEAYDFIVVADVIEHLQQPERLLSQLKLLIKPHGTILFSVPNITHLAAGLELLSGRFGYRGNGLLDNTHLRFYSRQSLLQRLRDSGLYAWQLDRVHKGLDETEFGTAPAAAFPPEWLAALAASREDALVYQWIVSARLYPPLEAPQLNAGEVRPKPLFSTALYWDDGSGFAEARKIIGLQLPAAEGELSLAFPFEAEACANGRSPQRLRIDPASRQRPVWIRSARVLDAAGTSLWDWHPPATGSGAELANAAWAPLALDRGALLVANSDDPQWYPPLPPAALQALAAGGRLTLTIRQDEGAIAALLNTELLTQAERRQSLQAQAEETRQQLQAARNEAAELRTALAEREQELAEREQKLTETRQELLALQCSRSWKITAPLRRFGHRQKKT